MSGSELHEATIESSDSGGYCNARFMTLRATSCGPNIAACSPPQANNKFMASATRLGELYTLNRNLTISLRAGKSLATKLARRASASRPTRAIRIQNAASNLCTRELRFAALVALYMYVRVIVCFTGSQLEVC